MPGGVDHLDVLVILTDVRRKRPDALDAIAFDDDGIVAPGRLPDPSISVPLRMTVVFGPLLLIAVLLYLRLRRPM